MKKLLVLFLLTGCADRIAEINHQINALPYVPEKHDCRNFAEEKYQALIENGYRSEDISFVITAYKGTPHVVLNVNGRILDNNYPEPYPETKELNKGISYEYWNYWRKQV